MKNRLYWYWLSKMESVSTRTTNKLLQEYGGIEAIYHAKSVELEKLEFLSKEAKLQLINKEEEEILKQELKKLSDKGIQFVTYDESTYPNRLRRIYDPPFFLYYKGIMPIEDKPTVAMIGARECSVYGREMARSFATALSDMGLQVISGLARGIDGYAHQGALLGNSPTFGVVGNGVDVVYPKENYKLYEQVANKGGIISEYPVGSPPLSFHFPMRNRLISGLSDGIFVIEARKKSGTLITVDCGLEQGKDVFALPGRVCDELSMGCNLLIQNGAKIVTKPEDILEEYQDKFDLRKGDVEHLDGKQVSLDLNEKEKKVYTSLSLEPKHIEEIAAENTISLGETMELLINLELKNLVVPCGGMSYIVNYK